MTETETMLLIIALGVAVIVCIGLVDIVRYTLCL